MFTESTPYRRAISDTLTLKSLSTRDEAERLAAFNAMIHGDSVAPMTHHLVFDHPTIQPHHWLFVEDETNGAIAATLNLIPWQWRYEDVTLRAGELGIVGTDPAYRKRGLIRALVAHHHELLREEGFDLSHIQGIPYFYRQFGYEYALPLEPRHILELRQAPAVERPLQVRRATLEDIPALQALYESTVANLDLHTVRDADIWRYLLGPSLKTGTAAECWLVLDENDAAAGYFRIEAYGFGEGLNICEGSAFNAAMGRAVIAHLKTVADARGKPYLRFNMPANSALVRQAQALGARLEREYAWQITIPDPLALLRKLRPIFERRVAASPDANLTRTVRLDCYRATYVLRFEQGKLVEASCAADDAPSDLNLPPELLPQLLFGHRTMREIAAVYPDASTRQDAEELAATLFPRTRAFFYANY